MERHFEADLQAVRERLLAMGSVAETMIRQSVRALVEREESLVQTVLTHEEEMDLLCIEIDVVRVDKLYPRSLVRGSTEVPPS